MYSCKKCETEFFSYPSQRTGQLKFCSRQCQTSYFSSERSVNWKGDAVGYAALHAWIKKIFPKPDHCLQCGNQEQFAIDGRSILDLANLSGEYKRELSDWTWLCRLCHSRHDEPYKKRKWANGVNCKAGHILAEVGFYTSPTKGRQCKLCNTEHAKLNKRRYRLAAKQKQHAV